MNHILENIFAATLFAAAVTGCKIKVSVPDAGAVNSTNFSCPAPSDCVIEIDDTDFESSFYAIPRPREEFVGWRRGRGYLCGGLLKPCKLSTRNFGPYPTLLRILESDTEFHLEPIWQTPRITSPKTIVATDLLGNQYVDIAAINRRFQPGGDTSSDSVAIFHGDGRGGLSLAGLFSTGGEATELVSGDMDQDGHTDLVTVQPSRNTIAIHYNQGNGNFEKIEEIGITSKLLSVDVGDLNNDGHMDLLELHTSNNRPEFCVLLGETAGSFSLQQCTLIENNPNLFRSGAPLIVLVDINNDRVLDVVATNGQDHEILIYKGNGSASFIGPARITTHGIAASIVFGDLNDDGFLDMVAGNGNFESLDQIISDGRGSFLESERSSLKMKPASLDIDRVTGDSYKDVIVVAEGGPNNGFRVRVGDGTGLPQNQSFYLSREIPPPLKASSATLADINFDGWNDLIINTSHFFEGRLVVYPDIEDPVREAPFGDEIIYLMSLDETP